MMTQFSSKTFLRVYLSKISDLVMVSAVDNGSFYLLLFGVGLVILGAFSIIWPFLISDNAVRGITIAALGLLFFFEGLRWRKTVQEFEGKKK
jgi:hypothetical protein